jgi:hypothetical protein
MPPYMGNRAVKSTFRQPDAWKPAGCDTGKKLAPHLSQGLGPSLFEE